MVRITYKINPMFVIMVIFFAGIGYLWNDTRGAVWGVVIMFSFSFLIGLIDAWVNRGKSDYERAIEEYRNHFRK